MRNSLCQCSLTISLQPSGLSLPDRGTDTAPPNRFSAACHLISSYNDTSLLFVQHTPEAVWCGASVEKRV